MVIITWLIILDKFFYFLILKKSDYYYMIILLLKSNNFIFINLKNIILYYKISIEWLINWIKYLLND